MKWSVTLTDRLGLEMLTVLEIKGQVLHRVRLHVKVPGLLLNLNASSLVYFSSMDASILLVLCFLTWQKSGGGHDRE